MQYLHAYLKWETMGISCIPAIPMIITCLLQGILCDTGIPRTFYGGNICSVVCTIISIFEGELPNSQLKKERKIRHKSADRSTCVKIPTVPITYRKITWKCAHVKIGGFTQSFHWILQALIHTFSLIFFDRSWDWSRIQQSGRELILDTIRGLPIYGGRIGAGLHIKIVK